MDVFIREALALVNLPLTALLVFVVVYWGLVTLGAVDMDAFDLDLDVDAGGEGGAGKLGYAVAHFFHCDEGPFMAIASLLAVFLWMGSMLLNHYFNPSQSLLIGAGLMLPNLIVSVSLTKAIVFPIFKGIRKLQGREEPAEVPMLGQVCRVVSLSVDARSGQAEIERHGAPLKINVRTASNAERLIKGDAAVIFEEDKENNTYSIKKLEV